MADCVSHNSAMLELRFPQAARRHRIGRASVGHVMASVAPIGAITAQGSPAWTCTGRDERGRELEVIAVEIGRAEWRDPFLLVIHVMPTSLRKGNRNA
jgi:hypothetical protein